MLATAYAIQAPPEAPLAPTVQAALPAPQVPPPAPPAPLVKTALPPEQPAPPAAKAAPVREALPELTEAEKMKLENLQLKAALLARQERDTIENQHPELVQAEKELQAQYNALIQQIVAEHPGYVWNPTTNSLIPAPPPHVMPAPAIKPAP